MEYINDININEAVINILDSNGGNAILNEYSLDLTDDVYRFIYKHTEKCLKDDILRYAKFNEERSIVKELCQDYLNGIDHNLIELSKELGRQMFAIMNGNTNIPSCDLIIASIVTDKGPMIVILRLDYERSFTHKVEIINEKIGIDLVPHRESLPSSNRKIKKAAFIKPIRENQSFDLMVLDAEISKHTEEYGGDYFTTQFLGCHFVVENRYKTKQFINNTELWIKENISDPYKVLKIKDTLRNELLKNETIDLNGFAEKALSNEEIQNYKVFMAGIVEEDFKSDSVYIDKKLKKVKLKIDNRIDLIMSDEDYKDRVEIVKNGDGTINLVVKFIEGIN